MKCQTVGGVSNYLGATRRVVDLLLVEPRLPTLGKGRAQRPGRGRFIVTRIGSIASPVLARCDRRKAMSVRLRLVPVATRTRAQQRAVSAREHGLSLVRSPQSRLRRQLFFSRPSPSLPTLSAAATLSSSTPLRLSTAQLSTAPRSIRRREHGLSPRLVKSPELTRTASFVVSASVPQLGARASAEQRVCSHSSGLRSAASRWQAQAQLRCSTHAAPSAPTSAQTTRTRR